MDFGGFDEAGNLPGRLKSRGFLKIHRDGKKEGEMSSESVWVKSSGDGEREL
jgi:hypothetical protein